MCLIELDVGEACGPTKTEWDVGMWILEEAQRKYVYVYLV